MPGQDAFNNDVRVTKPSNKKKTVENPYSISDSEYVDFKESKNIKMPWPIKNYGKRILIYGAAQEIVMTGVDAFSSSHTIGENALINLPSAVVYGLAIPVMVDYIKKNELETKGIVKTFLLSAAVIAAASLPLRMLIKNEIDENKNEIQKHKNVEPAKPQIQLVDSLEEQGEEMLAMMPKAISYKQALSLKY